VECLDRKAGLNEKETAICRSLRSLIERDLLDILLYERQVHIRALIPFAESFLSWIENWYLTGDRFLVVIPALIRAPVAYLFVYRRVGNLISTA
jgi:hypothetical protein